MRRVTPRLYLGGVGEFGDINALNAAGIELAFLCIGGPGFPHGTNIPAISLTLRDDGLSPDWFVKGTAKLLGEAYNFKVIGIFDQSGGLSLGAFLICCAAAEKLGGSFATRRAQLTALVPEIAIPPALAAQGATLYP
mgnify:CR=1 FL=1